MPKTPTQPSCVKADVSTKCPAHKVIPGTRFLVDGFKFAGEWCNHYFLSHGHSDHYAGLRESWQAGLIYCSPITARLVKEKLQIADQFLRPLPLRAPVTIEGVQVTLVDANHCPGAVQFLFALPNGKKYLHCGDMRFHARLVQDPLLASWRGCDAVFLDTTYCNPKYEFPLQEESVAHVARTVKARLDVARNDESGSTQQAETRSSPKTQTGSSAQGNKSVAVVISTYGIGKERILSAVAQACGVKICVTDKKLAVLRCLELEDYDIFTTDPDETPVHVKGMDFLGDTFPYFKPNFTNMEAFRLERGVDEVVGVVPTGWMYSMKHTMYAVQRKGPLEVHLVPYSEHSNYSELREYVRWLRPQEVIPTVGVDGSSKDKNAANMAKHFRNLVNETASKANFLQLFSPPAAGAQTIPELRAGGNEPPGNEVEDTVTAGDIDSKLESLSSGTSREEPEDGGGTVERPGADAAGGRAHAAAQQVLDIVGRGNLSEVQARRLLSFSSGDVAAAVNRFYDLGAVAVERSPSKLDSQPSSSKKRPAPETTPKQSKKSAPNNPAPKSSTRAAKSRAVNSQPVQQRTLLSFFNGTAAAPAHPQASHSNDNVPALAIEQDAAVPVLLRNTDAGAGYAAGSLDMHNPPQTSEDSKANLLPADDFIQINAATDLIISKPEASSLGDGEKKWWDRNNQKPPTTLVSTATKDTGQETHGRKLSSIEAIDLSSDILEVPEESGSDTNVRSQVSLSSLSPAPSRACPAISHRGGREDASLPDGLTLSPDEYNPAEHACWSQTEAAPYLHLARAFQAVEMTTKRLRIADVLINTFRSLMALAPEDVLAAAYLTINKLRPDHEGVELSVGGSTVSQAITEATGVSRSRLRELYRTLGDLGDVAQSCHRSQRLLVAPRPLSISKVYTTLLKIASESGAGCASRKQALVLGLLRACRECEMRYLVRTLVQNMRIGASLTTVTAALARAAVYHHNSRLVSPPCKTELKVQLQEAEVAMKQAFGLCPSLDMVVPALVEGGIQLMQLRCTLTPGVPVRCMLAKVATGEDDVLRQLKMAPFVAEFKYDGQRAQIHLLPTNEVRIFSRNCEDHTSAFPDVVAAVRGAAAAQRVTSVVLDAELVAVDPSTGRLRAFQELATRKRGSVAESEVLVQVCVFAFDLLYLDGQVLTSLPLHERRARLRSMLAAADPSRVRLASAIELDPSSDSPAEDPLDEKPAQTTIVAADQHLQDQDTPALHSEVEPGGEQSFGAGRAGERVRAFLVHSLQQGCEGLMLKTRDGHYQPGTRSNDWLKMKKDYVQGMQDSLDLVVIGAWHGNGRKVGWYSPYLLACWDPEAEEYQSVCRCMSGFTDAFYQESFDALQEHILEGPPSYYQTNEVPSVWFAPKFVWEIRGAELTVSPVHMAAVGHVHPDRGLSMRFPRYIRTRQDKSIEDASGPSEIVSLFEKQTRKWQLTSTGEPTNTSAKYEEASPIQDVEDSD